MVLLKKALSILLTVALLLTVLPLGLFGLTASAEETTSALTEHVIVGNKSYNVLANENYSAYNAYLSATSGLTATKAIADADDVTFGATGWSFNQTAATALLRLVNI